MQITKYTKTLSILIFSLFLFQVACDGNNFLTLPNEKCAEANNHPNTSGEFTEDGTCVYKHFYKTGQLDVLFVIDNSKSMYADQQKLAQKFPQFINSIWSYDFKIAIMTTDVTKAPVSNGQFITLSNGQTTLSNTGNLNQTEINNIFTNSITRQETLDCEVSINNCPSGDVRGIYASNLAMRQNKSFFRDGAHLAIVVLSDADERVFGGRFNSYKLDTNWDTSESLVASLSSLSADKTMSFHSIIINPGDEGNEFPFANSSELIKDTACYTEQNNQGPNTKGYYGREYFRLSVPNNALKESGNILRGTVSSICANDYSSSLGNISQSLQNNLRTIGLRCSEPEQVNVYYTADENNEIAFHISGNTIVLDQDIPPGAKVTVEMECPNIH